MIDEIDWRLSWRLYMHWKMLGDDTEHIGRAKWPLCKSRWSVYESVHLHFFVRGFGLELRAVINDGVTVLRYCTALYMLPERDDMTRTMFYVRLT